MSEEIKVADTWVQVECECPYCGGIQQVDGETGTVVSCHECNKEFIIGEHG